MCKHCYCSALSKTQRNINCGYYLRVVTILGAAYIRVNTEVYENKFHLYLGTSISNALRQEVVVQ